MQKKFRLFGVQPVAGVGEGLHLCPGEEPADDRQVLCCDIAGTGAPDEQYGGAVELFL